MATNSYLEYFKQAFAALSRYIEYIDDVEGKYRTAYYQMCVRNNIDPDKVPKSEKTIELENDIKASRAKAISLRNELQELYDKYKRGNNVKTEVHSFNTKLKNANLKTYNKIVIEPSSIDPPAIKKEENKNLAKELGARVFIGPMYCTISYNHAIENYGPDTAGMLDLAHSADKRINPLYEKDAIKLKNWMDFRVASDREYLGPKIDEQFEFYGFNPYKIPGYFFKNYSEPSQRIAASSEFLQTIKENKASILRGQGISMGFKESNLHNAFGMVDIRNGYLDKEGNLHIKMYDTYDFNPDEEHPLIEAGKKEMLNGNLKPYFTIHDIIIPKEKIKELWN